MKFLGGSPYDRNDISWVVLFAVAALILAVGLLFISPSRQADVSYAATRAALFITHTPTARPTTQPATETPVPTPEPVETATPTPEPVEQSDPIPVDYSRAVYTASGELRALNRPGGEEAFLAERELTLLFLTDTPSEWLDGEEWVEVQEILGRSGWMRLSDLITVSPDAGSQPGCDDGDKQAMTAALNSLFIAGRMTYVEMDGKGQLAGLGISDGKTRQIQLDDGTSVLAFHAYLVNPSGGFPSVWIAAGWTPPDGTYISLLNAADGQDQDDLTILSTPHLFRLNSPSAEYVHENMIEWENCQPASDHPLANAFCQMGRSMPVDDQLAVSLLMESYIVPQTATLFGFGVTAYGPPPMAQNFQECAPGE